MARKNNMLKKTKTMKVDWWRMFPAFHEKFPTFPGADVDAYNTFTLTCGWIISRHVDTITLSRNLIDNIFITTISYNHILEEHVVVYTS